MIIKSVFLTVSPNGNILGAHFANSVIRSSKRLSYEQAHALFSALRDRDARGAKTVFARCPAQEGVAMDVYNRLLRAAAFRVVEV